MAHTPAPWTADKLQDRDTFNIFASGFGTAMCQVSVMENSTRRVTGAEVAANAALIAAAPELLEMVRRLDTILRGTGALYGTGSTAKEVKALIAKAGGAA